VIIALNAQQNKRHSSKVVVTGIEVIETAGSRVVNSGNLVINQFKFENTGGCVIVV
jgi:hypothetical protein